MSGLLIFSCVFGDELYVGLGKSILGRFSLQFVKMSKRKAFDRCQTEWRILLNMYVRTLIFIRYKTISLNLRLNLAFAKVRVSLTLATLPCYFFCPLSAFLSIEQKQPIRQTNLSFSSFKNARSKRSFRSCVFREVQREVCGRKSLFRKGQAILLIRKRIRDEKNSPEGLQKSKKRVPLQMTN